ncbi:MAG: MBL fold metallo-hydrolase [Nitrospinae bacterium]|nr:MBL fold metallo-hydrolase [Nitrospinota bacterium]
MRIFLLSIYCVTVGPFQVNSYLVTCTETMKGIYIDPGSDINEVLKIAEKRQISIEKIIGTHAHIDHAEGVYKVKEAINIPYWLHEKEVKNLESMPEIANGYGLPIPKVPEVDDFLIPNQKIKVGNLDFKILLTDGHSPGNITLYTTDKETEKNHAIVGDSLFAGSIGRTDLPGGDLSTLLASIRSQLFTLPPDTIIYSGHGPSTTIEIEIKNNPFLN